MDKKVMIGELTRIVDKSKSEHHREVAAFTILIVDDIPLDNNSKELVYNIINNGQEFID